MRALIAFVLTAFFLTACGFKGPLHLPKPKTEAASSPNIASAASAVMAE